MAPRLPPPPMTAIPKETSADMSDNTTPLPSPTSTICVLDVEKGQEPLDVGPPPDGGAAAWLCVFSTFLVLFCIHGFVTSFGQLKNYYLEHQLSAYSESTISWIGSCQSTLTFIGSIFAGRWFDARGPRALVVLGTFCVVCALVSLAFCTRFYQFLLAHALYGIAGTIVYSPATAISGHWFLKKRSTAVGIIVCGSGLGGVVYPVFLKNLFDRISFRDSMLIIAAFNFALMLPACMFMKSRLPPRQPPPYKALGGPWKEAGYTFLVAGSGLYLLNVFTPYFNAPVLAQSNSLPPNIAQYSVAILQAGSFVGRAAAGVLADYFGVWNVFGTMLFGSAISVFAFWTPTVGVAPAIVGMVLFGIFSGGWFTLCAAACATISPVTEIGMRLGMLWTAAGVPILVGPVVAGLLVTAGGDKFTYAGIFCGITFLAASIVTLAPRFVLFIKNRADNEIDGGESVMFSATTASPMDEQEK